MRFDWILPGLLAGSRRPGLLAPLDEDLDQLGRFGFRWVINLTESPLVVGEDHPFEVEHFPIPDMGTPTPRDMAAVCRRVIERIELGEKTLVHCRAGLGRTGIFLACCLIHLGRTAEQAKVEVRLVNRRFIQSPPQELFVRHYETFLADQGEETGTEPG